MATATDIARSPSDAALADGCPGTLVIVAMETVWPPNHGGRVDRWNRWRLMKALGWRMVFVSWSADGSDGDADHRAAMASVFDECVFFPNRRSLSSLIKRTALLVRHSPHMASRLVPARQRRALIERLARHSPDAVVMDGFYGVDLGIALADEMRLPLVYRSHNIEHIYMPRQARAAKGLKRKLAMGLASLHLARAEQGVMRRADWVLDISADDMRTWQAQGIERISWLPPLLDDASNRTVAAQPWAERPFDAVYLGNLNTPNNVEGIAWFMAQVLPLLRALRPDISILFAGSNPSPGMRALVDGVAGVHLLPNPADVQETRAKGRVMINPVLQGSGVNVKSVEMLLTDSAVVTTSIGVQGLDADTAGAFLVADAPDAFANLIDGALLAGPVNDAARAPYRDRFGKAAAVALSAQLCRIIAQGKP